VSYEERPEFQALRELQLVLQLVTEELAAWRRRAQRAEAALGVEQDVLASRERLLELEAENRTLRARLEATREKVEQLLKRLQFLEEQMVLPEQRR
jgi:predicted nuclease with TOPRIM domain